MKEATGELNAVVVVIIAIGALIAFFYYTLWPLINNNVSANLRCNAAICEKCDSNNDGKPDKNCDTVTCHLKGKTEEFECVYKG